MYSMQVHRVIALIVSLFYHAGFWHRGAEPTARDLRIKFFYSIFYSLYTVSLVAGAIINESMEKTILLAEMSIASVVLAVKIWILIWKQNEILDLMNQVCVLSIQNDEDCNNLNDKLKGFTKFSVAFVITVIAGGLLVSVVLPFLGSERNLYFEIGFPLDYKNNEIAFWIATVFVLIGIILMMSAAFFSLIIWYLLFVCSLRYEVLGNELKRMGRIVEETKEKRTEQQKRRKYLEDLKASIIAHLRLRELTNELESYFSNVFLFQFGTSGLCICGSVYCLAFDMGDHLLEVLVHLLICFYFISDIFMITFFGNEIKLSSNRLSYCLFESDWIEQPQSTKKCIIIFGEYSKQPQELMVGKLYPLTLQTFTRILNSAYSMFNILKSFQK